MPKYDFAEIIERPIPSSGPIAIIPEVDGSSAALVRNTATCEFYVPVIPGKKVALRVVNYSRAKIALPIRIGGHNGWTNIFTGCRIVDADKMPATGGMWELEAGESFVVDAWRLSDGGETPLTFGPSDASFEGEDKPAFPAIEIYYRTPVVSAAMPSEDTRYVEHAFPVCRFYVVSRATMASEILRANALRLDPANPIDWTATMLRERHPSLFGRAFVS